MAIPAKILIVDDDPLVLRTYDRILQGWGHQVETVSNAEEALRLHEEQQYDLVLLDMILPGMSGIDFLRACHRRRRPPQVIVLTAYASLETAVEATKLGAYGFLSKPCRAEELQAHVARVLDEAQDPIVAFIQNNLHNIQSRRDVARHFGISPGTVSNRLRRSTQRPFAEFLRQCRVQKAKNLLEHTQLNVSQIAQRVGLGTPQSLARTFRRDVGQSPHQYRRQVRKQLN